MKTPHFSFCAALATLVTLLGLVATPSPASADLTPAQRYERAAHVVTNEKRVANGRRALVRNACLSKMARAQAARMARRADIFHQNLDNVQRECRMGWVGENVAFGYSSGRAVVNAWMASPGHRANILRREFRQEGLGAVRVDGVWYVAQVFGTPR